MNTDEKLYCWRIRSIITLETQRIICNRNEDALRGFVLGVLASLFPWQKVISEITTARDIATRWPPHVTVTCCIRNRHLAGPWSIKHLFRPTLRWTDDRCVTFLLPFWTKLERGVMDVSKHRVQLCALAMLKLLRIVKCAPWSKMRKYKLWLLRICLKKWLFLSNLILQKSKIITNDTRDDDTRGEVCRTTECAAISHLRVVLDYYR